MRFSAIVVFCVSVGILSASEGETTTVQSVVSFVRVKALEYYVDGIELGKKCFRKMHEMLLRWKEMVCDKISEMKSGVRESGKVEELTTAPTVPDEISADVEGAMKELDDEQIAELIENIRKRLAEFMENKGQEIEGSERKDVEATGGDGQEESEKKREL